jgi:putative FmdB family regulatory protein
MPIYEYECENCGKIEEALQKISDKPLRKCGHCSGKLHRLISQSSFHLKGTGWYVTDYAGKSEKAPAKTEKKADEPATPSAESPKTKTADAKTTD